MHEGTLLHEGSNMHKDAFTRGFTFAQRQFYTKGQFCTMTLLHEIFWNFFILNFIIFIYYNYYP